MIDVEIGRAQSFLTEQEYGESLQKAKQAFETVQDEKGPGAEWLGWRSLLAEPNDAMIEQIDQLATGIRKDADIFIVCGIGGSYLGSRAVIDALSPFYGNKKPEVLYAGQHMSGKYLHELIDYLDQPNEEGQPKNVYLNVISKSGTTLETALSFRVLRQWMERRYEDSNSHIICTTSGEGGALNKLITEYDFKKFIIPDDVGGRYSVLAPVGLLPIAVAGIDIRSLYYAAVTDYQNYASEPQKIIEYAAVKNALHNKGKAIDLLATFEPQLEGISRWLQQLLGESEGKNGKGMFPAKSIYSTDLHSLGQFVQQGARTMMETFLQVKNIEEFLTVTEQPENYDELNYLSGRSFHDINKRALEGVRQAHHEGGVPSITVTLEQLNEQNI